MQSLILFLQLFQLICRIKKYVPMSWKRTFSIFFTLINPTAQTHPLIPNSAAVCATNLSVSCANFTVAILNYLSYTARFINWTTFLSFALNFMFSLLFHIRRGRHRQLCTPTYRARFFYERSGGKNRLPDNKTLALGQRTVGGGNSTTWSRPLGETKNLS